MKPFQDAHLKFAVALFKKLIKEKTEENCIVSPICVQLALVILLVGASGKTAAEIKAALRLLGVADTATSTDGPVSGTPCDDPSGFYNWFKQLISLLNQHSKSHMLMMGSRIFGSTTETFLEEYQHCINDLCNAQLERVDFRNAPEDARQRINAWVEKQTNGINSDFIQSLDIATILVIISAISFKGIWNIPFNPKDTERGVFWTCKNKSTYVEMMTRRGIFDIANISNPPMKMLALPFADISFCMYIFLPDDHLSPYEIMNHVTIEQFRLWIDPGNIRQIHCKLCMPRFVLRDQCLLNKVFINMGMKDAFEQGKANLHHMTMNKMSAVTEMFHKAEITINEDGTEQTGLSRTEIVAGTQSDFKINKAFLFFVIHRVTGTIMFMGVACKP